MEKLKYVGMIVCNVPDSYELNQETTEQTSQCVVMHGTKRAIYRQLIVSKLTKLKNALVKKPFASWSQEEFLASIEEINRLAGELSSSQSQLLFCIVSGSYRTSPENEPMVAVSSDQESPQETEVQIPRRELSWDESWRSTLRISAFKAVD